VSVPEAKNLLVALSAASVALYANVVLTKWSAGKFFTTPCSQIPLSVLLIDLCLGLIFTVGLRIVIRLRMERAERGLIVGSKTRKVPTLLVGAGAAGRTVAKEISSRPDIAIQPIGFVDDNRNLVGTRIHGLWVLGTTADMEAIVRQHGAEQALVTIGNLPGKDIRRIANRCAECGIAAKIFPDLREMVEGNINFSRIRDVAVEDVLQREPVHLDNQTIAKIVRGRTILVSGAGGSIGSELCREVCRHGPKRLLLVEQAENSLFHIHRQLLPDFPEVSLVPCVADICDRARVEQVLAAWRPNVVFHAAAHKHVPLMEWNPGEAIKNNVIGTRCLADFSDAYGVERFVMISTDKAVNPTSIMGVSKRIAEIYVQALSQRSQTRFVTVRFGNVLGSAGSVIPIFKEQIARGGPITITHPDMKRYFMTIPEACQLVLQAGSMGDGGEIFILDMGKPVKIVDLAKDLIRLSGLSADEIEICFTGMRPGEKLFEELSLAQESAHETHHPKIFIGRFIPHPWEQINRQVDELRKLVHSAEPNQILTMLKEIVPEFQGEDAVYTEAEKLLVADYANGLPAPHPVRLQSQPGLSAVAMQKTVWIVEKTLVSLTGGRLTRDRRLTHRDRRLTQRDPWREQNKEKEVSPRDQRVEPVAASGGSF
jgi:FlaA1/EpsC-like NDP-sugar epimerase